MSGCDVLFMKLLTQKDQWSLILGRVNDHKAYLLQTSDKERHLKTGKNITGVILGACSFFTS